MLSFLKRKDSPAPAHAVDEAASVQAARTRARRRLIGAAVLVGVGIIGFPLLFETQPRPIAVDIPIVIPSRDNAPPLALKCSACGDSGAPCPACSGSASVLRRSPLGGTPPSTSSHSSLAAAANGPSMPLPEGERRHFGRA